MTTNWLDLDGSETKKEQHKAAVEFAQLYVEVFERNPAGKKILSHWVETIEGRDIPPSCSHAEYAYHEARRAFVRGIQRQIKFGLTGVF